MKYAIASTLLASLFLVACQNSSQAQKDAEGVPDNLVRVDDARVKMAYVDPDADFSKYTAILITPLGVDNVEIVQPTSSNRTAGNRNWNLDDKDKQWLQQNYLEAMTKQISGAGGYLIATAPADNVLEVSAVLTRIAPTAPKDDNRSRPVGRSVIITEGAGKLDIEITFRDAESGEVLALAKDRRSGSSLWGVNTALTNSAEVRRAFSSWAMKIRAALDRLLNNEAEQ